jgi:hypothetical protein
MKRGPGLSACGGATQGGMTAKRTSRRRSGGQVFPLLAIMSTVLFGFAALGIDTSQDESAQIQTQAASDASGVSASRVWSNEITSKSYTGAPPFQSGCPAGSICTINTSQVDPAVFEAAEVAKLNNISSLNLSQACVFSVGSGSGGSLHVAFYGTTVTSGNCPTVPSGFSAQRLDVYIPPQNPPSLCSPTWRCIEADVSDVAQNQSLAGVIGESKLEVGANSTVYAPPSTVITTLPCGACLLGTSGTTVSDVGSGSLTVTNGAILTNSTGSPAIYNQDNGGSISSTGTGAGLDIATGGTLSCTSACVPSTATSVSPIVDPYGQLPAPAVSGTPTAFSCNGGNHTMNPGVYSSISIGGGCNVSMDAGVYVIEGNMSMSGSGEDTSIATTTNGVMLYFTCSSYTVTNTTACNSGTSYTCANHGLSIIGAAQLNLTAPTTGTYQGMGLFYDRNLNSQVCLTGNASPSIGTIYAKSSSVSVTGNGGTQAAIVAQSLSVSGNGSISINGTVNSGVAPLNNGSTSGPSFSEIAA